ncbi:MAG: RNA 3'-terminal phosphate cyclase [Candidatus Helarchaeales archaeon]
MPIEIDGSVGEGGGAILRLSAALSILVQKPVHVFNIRKNRPKPGLKTQHLRGLEALASICNGKLMNGHLGAEEITFFPGNIDKSEFEINIETAGSIGLLLQLLTLACVRIKKSIKFVFRGGATFGLWAPTIPYLERVTFEYLKEMGLDIKLEIQKHGFYPKGGARVISRIQPRDHLKALNLPKQGKIYEIEGISIASKSLEKRNVSARQAKAAEKTIKERLQVKSKIKAIHVPALNPGSGLCLIARTDQGVILGADKVGEKKVSAEEVGRKCALSLIREIVNGATCDKYCSDQLIPYIALAEGHSEYWASELTDHARTNIWLVKKILGEEIKTLKEGNRFKIMKS